MVYVSPRGMTFCPRCHATGVDPDCSSEDAWCPECNGNGWIHIDDLEDAKRRYGIAEPPTKEEPR